MNRIYCIPTANVNKLKIVARNKTEWKLLSRQIRIKRNFLIISVTPVDPEESSVPERDVLSTWLLYKAPDRQQQQNSSIWQLDTSHWYLQVLLLLATNCFLCYFLYQIDTFTALFLWSRLIDRDKWQRESLRRQKFQAKMLSIQSLSLQVEYSRILCQFEAHEVLHDPLLHDQAALSRSLPGFSQVLVVLGSCLS